MPVPKNQAPNMYLRWPNSYDYDMVVIDWRCDTDASSTYWAVHQFEMNGTIDGYAGFINRVGNHDVLFSLWELNGYDPEIEYMSPWTDQTDLLFSNEGNGKHLYTHFNWQVGSWYSMCVGVWTMCGKTYYAQWVKKYGDSNWLLCAVMSFPLPNKIISYSSFFQEDYGCNNLPRKCSVKRSFGRSYISGSWHNRNYYEITNRFFPYAQDENTFQDDVRFDCNYGMDSSVPCIWVEEGGESLTNPVIHPFILPDYRTLAESAYQDSSPQFATIVPRYIRSLYSNLYIAPTSSGQIAQQNEKYYWIFNDSGDGFFYIMSWDKTKAITASSDGSTLSLADFTGNDDQKWTKRSYYHSTDVYISPKDFPTKCMDIVGPSSSAGALIQLWTFNPSISELRFYIQNDAEFKTIKNNYSSKYVAPSGSNIIQRSLAYRWNFVPACRINNEQYYYILTQDCLNAITVDGVSDGSNLKFSSFNIGEQKQMWKISDAGNGLSYLVPKVATSKNMDIEGPSTSDGAILQLWAHTPIQPWFKWVVTNV